MAALRVITGGAHPRHSGRAASRIAPGGVVPAAPCRHVSEQRQPVRHGRERTPRLEVADASAGQVDPRSVRAGSAVQDQRPLAIAGEVIQSHNLAEDISEVGMAPAHLAGDAAVGQGNDQVARSSIVPGIVQDRKSVLRARRVAGDTHAAATNQVRMDRVTPTSGPRCRSRLQPDACAPAGTDGCMLVPWVSGVA
jgi:hypothetical protein